MNILVVDDAIFMRQMLKDILTKAGHTVIAEASNGKKALDMYKAHNPDLVTMDITMPDVDGLEGVRLIREYDKNATILMCSAMGQQAMVIEAIKLGAKDFIVKPFSPERVYSSLNKLVK